ncbi:nitronate monooxygenase [Yinghuangia seranimata]|uniref:nitronate monooxygenase n=1 Tax=Yinghuangia seranimata TaxID=408067 RepID=UPI00248B00B6|nr:nitronate monooxygenase [Yinghuangia seranimata]MDI2130018.1 nitronate monooxygenase [Yinghuangia seranimata]
MRTPVTELLGIELPLFAFSHCRDVVAAVTNAGGFGVLGAASHTPEELELELRWIDEHVGGRPYGVDLIAPASYAGKGEGRDPIGLWDHIPAAHRKFVDELLAAHGVEPHDPPAAGQRHRPRLTEEHARDCLDIAFAHPIRLIANALGVPPDYLLARGKAAGVPVAALVGTRDHAVRQVEAGVDIVVAQGTEAGGHVGEVSTMVLVPEVVDAVRAATPPGTAPVPVLAAGGIVNGAQMAAALALGAAGAWTGSVWLTCEEAETAEATKAKMVAATSSDTVRSRARTGKPSRQLRSAWTEAWAAPDAPPPLPMPIQSLLSEPALRRVDRLAAAGHEGARELATYFVGQGVGMMNRVRPAREVVYTMAEEFAAAVERLGTFLDE